MKKDSDKNVKKPVTTAEANAPTDVKSKEIQEVEDYWKRLQPKVKRHRRLRNQQATELLAVNKNKARGLLVKFVELGFLVPMEDAENDCTWYLSNEENFYAEKPEELFKLVPQTEFSRIAVASAGFNRPHTIFELAHVLYGREDRGTNFLHTLLDYWVEKNHFKRLKKTASYVLTQRGLEFGIDAQTVHTMDTVALENQIFMKSDEARVVPSTEAEVEEALSRDLKGKTISPIDLSKDMPETFRLLFLCEILYGNQFTNQQLVRWVTDRSRPDLTISSGLVQGTFAGKRVDKMRILAQEGNLNKIDAQFHVAGKLLDKLGKISKKSIYVQSDDDWDSSESYAIMAQLAEGKVWRHGFAGSLLAERGRRLHIAEYYKKWKMQWSVITPYQYRIRRSLKNASEVFDLIGIWKSEYRLIVEIMVAKRNSLEYPKTYEKVVDVVALFGDKSKNEVITPDNAFVKLPGNRVLQFVHNTGFSNITQYVDSLLSMESVIRNRGARNGKLPFMIVDGHQERFYATYLQGTWIMNMPGMQNTMIAAEERLKEFNKRILSSKAHRQNTFRKEPVTSGAVEIEVLEDGRVRYRLMNDRIRQVLESQKDKPEVREGVVHITDTQNGSITMWPELVIKFMDYGLYHRKASRCYGNGDIIHGVIYPQHLSENRPIRLTSVDSQQRFTIMQMGPLLLEAPNLIDFAAWMGNHEWNIWGNSITGQNALYFLEAYLQGALSERARNNRLTNTNEKLMRAMTVSRVRWLKTHNPQPDPLNWPFFKTDVAGFQMAIQHMWQPFGGGRTPVDQQRRWLRNMASACRDIDIMFGGDKHSLWMSQEADKWQIQMPAAAGQSGYELARGLMSTVLFTYAEFSNRDGITVEFVPWQFLNEYKCESPAYKGKDADLLRPEPGTRGYQRGRMAPLIESMIDDLTQYLEI